MSGIYAISDLHLPIEIQIRKFKYPLDYYERIKKRINDPEVLIIAGDFSWETHYIAGVNLLDSLKVIPGKRKVFIAGNHDVFCHPENWRNDLLNRYDSNDLFYLSGRSLIWNISGKTVGLCGTMGWVLNDVQNSNMDQKFFHRELENLRASLNDLESKLENNSHPPSKNICILHHPPTYRIYTDGRTGDESFFELIKEYNMINTIIYGHIHVEKRFDIYKKIDGIELYCVAIDQLDFHPVKIAI
jgi:predicted phosphohydrolase